MEWDNVIIAILMALPPIVAQILAGIRENRDSVSKRERDTAETRHIASEEWRMLYEASQKEITELHAEIASLEKEIEEKDKTILDLTTAKRRRGRPKSLL